MRNLVVIALFIALAACEDTPTRGGEEPPKPDCAPNAKFCAN